jgi:hypothetical protein
MNFVNQRHICSSPFLGKQTFTITELTVGGPGAQLFQLPDYPIHDQRKTPPVSHSTGLLKSENPRNRKHFSLI